jgi:hypothetical protein
MRLARVCIRVAIFSLTLTAVAHAESDGPHTLFREGKFAEAGAAYARIVANNPDDQGAILGLGRIALLSDRLDEAEAWFRKAIALAAGDVDARIMLGAALYRQDDFAAAAAALEGVELAESPLAVDQYPTLNLAVLESFEGQTPYEVEGDGRSTSLKFLRTDPLPLVSVRINGGSEVTFFIDTGGSVVTLDSDFARELGVQTLGSVQGTFSGGQTANVGHGRIEEITLGDWKVAKLPVVIMPLRQLSEGLGTKRIDGIIGTTLFYHFLATLDYPKGELVLRRKDAASQRDFLSAAGNAIVVPFWIASDHFMVAWGQVQTLPPTLLFVDSGLAGAGVKLAESVIKSAGIVLEEDKATEGAGGGGSLKTVPFVVSTLAFGNAKQKDVAGLYDGPFPWETMFGFELSGMVGHDFLKQYAVTFDFESMQIFLLPASP